ncbi:MAG: hypothetical protein VXY91_04350 [Bacteroidota bacterium]|nr:hypothetical protein [Bacteroidota bacterium]
MPLAHLEYPQRASKFGKTFPNPETNELFLLTTPTFRKGNASFLSRRGLGFINALAKIKVQVLGSFWLPGLHIYNSQSLKPLDSFNFLNPRKILVATTNEKIESQNWYSFKGDPFMIIENRWETIEQYEASLKKKYRARYKNASALKNEFDFRKVYSREGLQKCGELLAHTIESKVVALPKNTFFLIEGFKEYFGNDYHVIGAFSETEIIGFIGYIKTPTTLQAMHFGAVEHAAEGLYSALMFEVIQCGIKMRVQEVNLGRTATEIKSTYGAIPRDNYFSFHTKNPIIKFVLNMAQKRYKPKEYILRSPFKE